MKYNEREWKELVLSDSRFSEIGGLPSDYHPYPELKQSRKFYIRPFTMAELRLVSKSIATKDIRHIIRAVDLVIDYDVNDLSIGDFYFLLLWLRLHSYPKSPMMVQWPCTNKIYKSIESEGQSVRYLESGKEPSEDEKGFFELVECNTQNAEAIHNANTVVHDLPDEVELPEGFDFPRVRDLTDITKALKDPELTMLVKGLQWIAGTWEEKIKKLDGPNGIDLYDTGSALADTFIHGIGEHAVLTCRSCRNKVKYQVELNAASFFR
jgi:hypothetical protein